MKDSNADLGVIFKITCHDLKNLSICRGLCTYIQNTKVPSYQIKQNAGQKGWFGWLVSEA